MSLRPLLVPIVWLLGLSGVHCHRESDAAALITRASSSVRSDVGSSADMWHYAVDAGRARVDMAGIKEDIQGDASRADGVLDVAPREMGASRATIRVDLATFATHTFHDDRDATQTKHARTWLEVQVGDSLNEKMRWAEFIVRSIGDLSASDLTQVHAAERGGQDVRTVEMTVHGDLLLHGHVVPKDARVVASFYYPMGAAPSSKPTRIEIDSKDPLHVVLKEHDVGPRDPKGQVLAWSAQLITKVAETANVSIHVGAAPAF
ncbi:MAG: hypothetical protein ABSC94_17525 [Polyangiaceae bacterium]